MTKEEYVEKLRYLTRDNIDVSERKELSKELIPLLVAHLSWRWKILDDFLAIYSKLHDTLDYSSLKGFMSKELLGLIENGYIKSSSERYEIDAFMIEKLDDSGISKFQIKTSDHNIYPFEVDLEDVIRGQEEFSEDFRKSINEAMEKEVRD